MTSQRLVPILCALLHQIDTIERLYTAIGVVRPVGGAVRIFASP